MVIPIIGGGRLSGKASKWSLGALNIARQADSTAKVPLTDFTVLRARRDVLGRSTVGVMVANRSQSVVAPGANTLVGVDGNFSFFQNVYLSGYVAATSTPTRDSAQASYRGNFSYGSDRYGFALDRMVVDRNFNPEIGFVPRQNIRRNFASARFSPRPRRARRADPAEPWHRHQGQPPLQVVTPCRLLRHLSWRDERRPDWPR